LKYQPHRRDARRVGDPIDAHADITAQSRRGQGSANLVDDPTVPLSLARRRQNGDSARAQSAIALGEAANIGHRLRIEAGADGIDVERRRRLSENDRMTLVIIARLDPVVGSIVDAAARERRGRDAGEEKPAEGQGS
jgi:hypothetical protein